ncbi:MAG TPA: M3 family metallopeptidase [Longimicrobiaceae bacterium]|jgi:oligopeptidase A|nr:M3 family metallopeptidase [Longimicrobiaceae bacterium]
MNPLLSPDYQIPFDQIRPEHVVPAVREALARAERELDEIVAHPGERTYENTVHRLDDLEERLTRIIRPVAHLVAVMNTPEMREAYDTILPEFSAFYARLPLNAGLWKAYKDFASTHEAASLTGVRKRHLEKTVREFVRAGADLPDADKQRVEALRVELSQAQTEFANNTLDATNAFELVVTDPSCLSGLPASAMAQARASAEAKGVDGWRFTLQLPSYAPFMQYADDRALRERMYAAYMNRAAGGEQDNRPLVGRILGLRRQLAGILGFKDWADYTLEDSMAGSGARAVAFEADLAERTRPFWEKEVAGLTAFARDEMGIGELQPWDTAYAAEKMRRARYDLDEEELRPYFPMDRVLQGLFEVARRLFGVTITPRPEPAVWHPEVCFYEVHDEAGTHLGGFYTDFFPRESKRGGAWMNGLITGGPRPDGFAPHLAVIAANVSPPEGDRPALLTHREAQTVFHEFGHLLHHTLSRVEIPAMGGTSVSTDWVELPSQIMENWTWEREALDLFARHHETGEPIPDELYHKMLAARTFMAANTQNRQLSFGTVDLDLHVLWDPERDGDPISRAQEVMARFSIRPEFARNHFITAFTHVFAGGYAAGYYSYLWSEVLDADAFSRFAREGIFNRETGRAFVDTVLARGDSEDPAQLFREFMGRDPDPDALLRRNLGAPI